MIHHFSFAAENPRKVADALAELLGGRVVPFHAREGGFMALSGNAHGTSIEVYPMSVELAPNAAGYVEFRDNPSPSRYTPTHAAVSVPVNQEKILAIAAREGWTAQRTQRGPFDFIELWVENRVMLELFPPELDINWANLGPPPGMKPS
jgi:hypothetical protein